MNIAIPIFIFILVQFSGLSVGRNVVQTKPLAAEKISLEKRYEDPFVNGVFKDNILLNVAYLAGKVTKKEDINWDQIKKPFNYEFTLMPGKIFAYHGDVLSEHANSVVVTTKANFNYQDGFKSDGYLTGDGVCHLASLINWAAKAAGLDSHAPTNHDFAVIPEIDRKYGVSIYKSPGQTSSNARQNLYVTNNKKNPVVFEFNYRNNELKLSISEVVKSVL